jgi:hypothetical protein
MRKKILAVIGTLLVLGAAGATASARTATPDVRLLGTYEPVLQFDPLERFQTTKVQSFVTDSALEQQTSDGWTVAAPNAGPGNLPATGTWRLNQTGCTPAAPLGGLDCYASAAATGAGGPTLYGHVVREDGDIVLQYWAFYYDDVYSYTYPASDFIWQAHEGDWEAVTVVLSGDEQPLYVGLSEHCLGERQDWADTNRVDDTHLVVHVAVGSHANYFTAGTHPIAVACIPPAAVAVLQANHLPLPVDYAFGGGAVAGPPGSGGQVMPVDQITDDRPGWVQFPGSWGEQQYFHAPLPIGTVAFGTSPVGPAFHPEWRDPLGTLATWPLGSS